MAKPKKTQNTGKSKRRTADYLILAVIAAVACTLLLSNLGNQHLWQDEAETALISKTILTHGIPMGHDGKNSFSQFNGNDVSENGVSRYHPWFAYYLLAGFFALFDTSTFVARLPFALFGVATVLLIYYFAVSLQGTRRAGIFAALCLLLSVPFLILCRQCRYYAPEMFFCLLGLYSYYCLLAGRKHAAVLLFGAAMLLFHCHFVVCAALLATLLIHTLLWRRDLLRVVAIVCATVAILNLPWAVFFSATAKGIEAHGRGMSIPAAAVHLLGQITKHVLHPLILILVPLVIAVHWRRAKRWPKPDAKSTEKVSLLLLFVVVNVVTAAITPTAPWFRVIAPSVPVCVLLIAMLVEMTARISAAAAVASIAALAYFSPMSNYLYEITHDFDGPVEGIVTYLKAHAKQSDTVVITYDDMPLKFYTNLRVLGGYTGEDLKPALTAEWIILRANPLGVEVGRYVADHVVHSDYEDIDIPYPDTPTENREEPELHYYRTVTDAPLVNISRRISK